MQIGQLTSLEGSIFSIENSISRPYEFFDDVHTTVTFEFNLNYARIDRETYNALDWLGDLGGLKEALAILFALVYSLFHYYDFEDFLVSKLYRPSMTESELSLNYDSCGKSTGRGSSILNTQKLNCFMKRLYEFKCSRKIFFKTESSHRYKLFKRGRNMLEN